MLCPPHPQFTSHSAAKACQAGGKRWTQSRLEKAVSVGKGRSKQNQRDREMLGKLRAAGLHKWGGGTKLPSLEMERTRSGGRPTCLDLSSLNRVQEKAQAFRCNAEEDYVVWWLTIWHVRDPRAGTARGGGQGTRNPKQYRASREDKPRK